MFAWLLLLIMLVPVVEVIVLIWLATQTSALFVLGLVIAISIVGVALARYQGFRVVSRISDELNAGHMPADSLLDGLLVLFAAGLLIIPGLLSDVVAISLLFPPTRHLVKHVLRRRFAGRVVTTHFSSTAMPFDHDQIIDVKVIDSPPPHLPG